MLQLAMTIVTTGMVSALGVMTLRQAHAAFAERGESARAASQDARQRPAKPLRRKASGW